MESHATPRHPFSLMSLQHRVAGADAVNVRKDVRPLAGHPAIDVYEPAHSTGAPRPWVLFVNGLSDTGARPILGCAIKDMGVVRLVGTRDGSLGRRRDRALDGERSGCRSSRRLGPCCRPARTTSAWRAAVAAFGHARRHVPNALGLLLHAATPVRAAVLCYGYMLDLDGMQGCRRRAAHVALRQSRRRSRRGRPGARADAGPCARAATRRHTVNESIDAFVRHALVENFPLTLVNYPDGVHAFDLTDASAVAGSAVSQILHFVRQHLLS